MKPSLMWALAWPNSNGNTMRGLCPRWDAQAVMATRWNMSIKRHSPPAGRFVHMIHRHWSGWSIVLFEDRGSPHTAATSRRHAKALGIAVRFLPRATPELNAMDHLWRYVQGRLLANRATQTIDASADAACQALLAMSRHERLRKAGVLSGHFWLNQ